ncbi:MAG: outer membrane beta-barrel protein [Crocinitomicaceae bacterium]
MKKTLLLFAAMFLIQMSASAQAVMQGNVLIDAYYGFPDLYKTTLRNAYNESGNQNLKLGGIGPIGGRLEYMLSDKFGLGLDIAYTSATVTYNRDTVNMSGPVTYEDKVGTKKIGGMVTFNYHFVENDKLDAYAMLGAGYRQRTWFYESTDPDFQGDEIKGLIPVAFRIGAGMRYFFTENIGMNLALGLGQGGLINGGITAKF